ncbi:MAG TPA: carboxylating nicotinate-nucleotide diphosphorylase [Candidatus Bathyarchaeia archaeon]|nr:carboxylating nicotinate-nucleotide diphosphorylase [Candidatus Bathyarchaeia archaeon]
MSLPRKIMETKLRRFVEEDVGHGDVTTFCTVPFGTVAEAEVIAKEEGVIAGLEEALIFAETFGLQAEALVKDGSSARPKTRLLHIKGDAATMLTIERTLLNLLSMMSGIATHTNRLVEKIRKAGYKARVAATRKTTPGMAYFEKKAVMVGGADSHRWGMDDMILIKDNHITIVGNIRDAIKQARKKASFSKKIEVEVSRVDNVLEAAKAQVDIIMLDNFTPKQIQKTIELLKKNKLRTDVLVEVSGGINEQNILKYAAIGVDIISLSEITQNAKPLDLSLEITDVKKPRA